MDELLMQIITDSMDGGWLPHWNLCTSSFYMWIKDPITFKSLLLKDVWMDLKRIDLILDCIFLKQDNKDFVSSIENLITQRERLEFIYLLLKNETDENYERAIEFDFCTRQLNRKKLEFKKYQIGESDPLLDKYKQRAIQKVLVKN
jgi:hypothetical protein